MTRVMTPLAEMVAYAAGMVRVDISVTAHGRSQELTVNKVSHNQ